ncbi:MAG: DUF2703 domain-containing protein [Clostridia bacterium]|nr:DUF2703 domain-containing protein [Clostridia bacterium]
MLRELGLGEFRAMPAESNRIWMAGKPLGDWLGTTSGQRLCCAPKQVGCCG